MDDSHLKPSAGSSPLITPDSDSALGTLSDITPDDENSNINSLTNCDSKGDMEEENEGESVVSASMQFALTPIVANIQNGKESPATEIASSGVPVHVKHQKLNPSATLKQVLTLSSEKCIEERKRDLQEEKLSPENKQEELPHIELPETVSRLTNEYGSEVYLVGTAHFSLESQEDVSKTIRMVHPDIVMVELCKSRTAVLQLDEETILNESKSLDFNKMCVIVRQHGKIQGILYLLLLSVSAHITKQLGMAPGGEFRAAFAEARRSAPGCLIQLGDRPIQITLSRALASLSVWQKMKLMWHIMASKEPISKEEVEKCKQKDFIEEMLAEMTGQFPAISEVFVRERDVYLTKSLQTAAQPIPDPRSLTGFSPRVVVGVVGIGHVQGIKEHWGKVTDDDIPPIMRIPPPTLSDKIFKITIRIGFYGIVVFGIYKCLPRTAKESVSSMVQSSVAYVSKFKSI
ncbi:UNVERIFIED_CONTAM: hypothetical protein RMT77_006336 [Armadillidium vulgare]